MDKKKTGNIFSFILPYLLIFGIIIVLLVTFGGFSKPQASGITSENALKLSDYDLDSRNEELINKKLEESALYTYTIKDLTISKKPSSGLISVSGHAVEGEKNTTFSFTIDYASYNSALEYVISHRVDTSGKTYFTNVKRVDPYEGNFWSDYFPSLLISGIGIVLILFLFSRMSNSINKSNNSALDFNRSRARREDASNVRFDDVAGCDECKAEMVELVDYLRQPEKYSKFGAKLPKGVLLVGPPGTGKTLLAKAVAGEAKVPFYSISGSDFKKAKQTAPCLIFIDEIDAVGRQRGTGMGGGNDEREQTLNQLLVEMDGFSDNAGIIVIAATNRDDVLDPALLRAGRFDRKITVDLPDKEGREAILKVHAKNKKIAKDVDFSNIAKRTVGFSGADLANILNEAAILAVRENEAEVTVADIDEAIDRRIAGPAKSNKSLSSHEKSVVAHHEAGHAIIGMKLPYSDKVQKVTIIPRGRTGGHVLMTPEEDRFLMSKAELEARIVGYLGGRASEEIFFDDVSTGASNDIEVATRIARAMVTQYGMSRLGPIQYEQDQGSVFLGRDYTSAQKNFSLQVANEIDAEVRRIVEEAHKKAIDIINQYKDRVIVIANVLMEKETITAEEIAYLMDHDELPKVEKKVVEEEKSEEKPTEETKVEEKSTEEEKPVDENQENNK